MGGWGAGGLRSLAWLVGLPLVHPATQEMSPRPDLGGGLPFQPCQLIKSSDGVKVPASTSGYPKAVLAQNLE